MSLPHDSAHNHVTGKSEYVDDRIILKNELFCGEAAGLRSYQPEREILAWKPL